MHFFAYDTISQGLKHGTWLVVHREGIVPRGFRSTARVKKE